MSRKWILITLFSLLALPLLLTACAEEPATPTAPDPTAVSTALQPTATIPPVMTPTIVIPEVTKTEPPAETATSAPLSTGVPTEAPSPQPVGEIIPREMPRFAEFKQTAVDAVPAMFHDPIAPDLSNVIVPFPLSLDQRARLAASGVVVSPGTEKEFFSVYEQARYANVPIFVTSDTLLHSYHLIFDKVLRTAERQSFIPLLSDLNAALLAETDAQYQALIGSEWEDAAMRSVAFIGVGSKLARPNQSKCQPMPRNWWMQNWRR